MNQLHLQKLLPEKDITVLQIVLEGAPKYSINISGHTQLSTASLDVFKACPEGFDINKKLVLGVYQDNALIGVIDLLRGFPSPEVAMLGLLLIMEDKQGQGNGTKAFNELLEFLKDWNEIKIIRISVIKSNDEVITFWKKLEFIETGIRKPYNNGRVISEMIILERNLE